MKTRVGAMVGQIVEGMPWLGTFHSIGVKILRRHAELVGLKSNFTILDVDDQIRLLKQLLEVENIDEKSWPARVLAGMIDGWKNRGLTPDAGSRRRGRRLRQRPGKDALRRLSGAAEDAQRRRLRRSAAGEHPAVPRAPGRAAAISARASNIFWSTSIRTPMSRNICGCGCWRSRRRARPPRPYGETASRRLAGEAEAPQLNHDPQPAECGDAPSPDGRAASAQSQPEKHLLRRRRRPVDLWLARRGGRQHPALREGFSRRRR